MRNLFTIIAILSMFTSYALDRVIVDKESEKDFSKTNTLFVIRADLKFAGEEVEIGSNSILQFDGGSIENATLVGNNNIITAIPYQIFKNCTLTGNFRMKNLPVEWFGAKCDGITDDSKAINDAITYANGAIVDMGGGVYYVKSPILVNKTGVRIDCSGTIRSHGDISVFNISANHVILNIKEILNDVDDDISNYCGTAILFSDNSFHPTLNVLDIERYDKGIAFIPKASEALKYSGIQYAQIKFQRIKAKYCLYFNPGEYVGKNTHEMNYQWVNENQFFGGRLMGEYGIYTVSTDIPANLQSEMNGNVFNSIGFEEIHRPITLFDNKFSSFRDLRMSESITDSIYIKMDKCEYLTFDIKSIIPYHSIVATDCMSVQLSRCFTDNGLGRDNRYDKMYVDRLLPENKIITSDLWTKNTTKSFYYDINHATPESISFNDLFCRTWDGQPIMSNVCKFEMWDNITVNINLNNSCYKLHPEMTFICELHGGSSIQFFKDKDNLAIADIKQSGLYKISFDRDNKLYIHSANPITN